MTYREDTVKRRPHTGRTPLFGIPVGRGRHLDMYHITDRVSLPLLQSTYRRNRRDTSDVCTYDCGRMFVEKGSLIFEKLSILMKKKS